MSFKTYDMSKYSTSNVESKENILSSVIINLKLSKDEINHVKSLVRRTDNKSIPMPFGGGGDRISVIPYNMDKFQSNIVLDVPKTTHVFDHLDMLLMENEIKSKVDNIKHESFYELMSTFVGMNIWPQKVDINCWWCKSKFDTIPCAIPESKNKCEYQVYGCFCSFNCCLAYIYDENDYNKWDKIMLLKEMSIKMGHQLELNKFSPSWKLLKSFGGILTVEQFRTGVLTNLNTDIHNFSLKLRQSHVKINPPVNNKHQSKAVIEKRNQHKLFYIKNTKSKKNNKLSSLEKSMGIKFT